MKNFLMVMLALAADVAGAWDVEHDEVAQLTGEFLPAEVKATFDFKDFGILLANCHYPDMTEWGEKGGPRRFRTLDEIGAQVGADDKAILKAQGYVNSGWLHRERGRAVALGLLAKAFQEGNHANAAFYLSVLTHSVSDDSALNHPPLLQFVQYSRFEGVDYAIRKVEEGAKNVFGFRSDGQVVHRVRELMAGYRPQAWGATFAAARDRLVADCVRQGAYAARQEGVIAFAPRDEAAEALAQLVAMQVRVLEDCVWTAWTFRASWSMPDADYEARINAELDRAVADLDPAPQGVFADVFDAAQNPSSPKGVVGVVCEPYGLFSKKRLSYVGRMLSAASARTLRDAGWSVKGIALRDVEKGLPPPAEMPLLLLDFGPGRFTPAQRAALKAYLAAGGRLIATGGDDPDNVTGFKPFLERRADEEVPVSSKWALQNVEVCKKMSVVFAGATHPLKRNPNIDGFCKPYAPFTVREAEGIEPIAWLENGAARRIVAARRGRVVWLSQYLLMPFVFSDATTANWAHLRLDAFGARVLLHCL